MLAAYAGTSARLRGLAGPLRRATRSCQIENDYDKEVYNGDIGFVSDVEPEEGNLTASFDGRVELAKAIGGRAFTRRIQCGLEAALTRFVRFLARARAAPLGQRFRSGGAGAELSGRQQHDPIETAGRGGLWRVCALAFQAG